MLRKVERERVWRTCAERKLLGRFSGENEGAVATPHLRRSSMVRVATGSAGRCACGPGRGPERESK